MKPGRAFPNPTDHLLPNIEAWASSPEDHAEAVPRRVAEMTKVWLVNEMATTADDVTIPRSVLLSLVAMLINI